MHIQDPQQQQLIGAQAHALQQRKEALNKAIEALNTRRDNIGKRLATAEALQAEALTLRQNARQSLRDMIGIPGKPTREAKEKELAAQSQGLRTRTSYGFEPKYPDAFFVRPCGGLALHAQAHLAVFSHRDWPHQIQHHLFQ